MYDFLQRYKPSSNILLFLFIVIIALTFMLDYGFGVSVDLGWLLYGGIQGICLAVIAMMVIAGINLRRTKKRLERVMQPDGIYPCSDVTDQYDTAPESIQQRLSEIEALGFSPFAVIDSSEAQDKSQLLWYYSNATHTIRAYTISIPTLRTCLTGFITILADETVIETGFRVQLNLTESGIITRNVTNSLEAAYAYHLHQLETYIPEFGNPIVIDSAKTLLHYSERLRYQNQVTVLQHHTKHFEHLLTFYSTALSMFILLMVLGSGSNMLRGLALVGLIIVAVYKVLGLEDAMMTYHPDKPIRKKKKR